MFERRVHHALSLLLIHTRFDDVTRSHGWNKFRGLRVDWLLHYPGLSIFCLTSAVC